MIAAGTVAGTDMVWRDGMTEWRPLSTVAELLPAGPPPAGGQSPYLPPATAVPAARPQGRPVSGLAVASLVCGLLGVVTCTFFPGIAAVVCGHMALSRMKEPGVDMDGKGMAVTGLVSGYLSVAVMVLFVLLVLVGAFAGMA